MARKSTLAVCSFVGVFLIRPAFAVLGIGDVVFDPTNYAEEIQQLAQLERQYVQLAQTYETVLAQYEQMLTMAKQVPVNMLARYRALATPWTLSLATNTYGTTAAWGTAVNLGQGVTSGYAAAVRALQTYGSALGTIPSEQQERIKTDYATVELTDGANLSAIQTIGQMRGNASQVENTIRNLEADSLSSDPGMNTEIAVLNKINAANVINVRNAQDANKLLVALAEARIVEAKRTRDAEAQSINDHIRFTAEGQAAMTAQAAGASDAMLAWRMP